MNKPTELEQVLRVTSSWWHFDDAW